MSAAAARVIEETPEVTAATPEPREKNLLGEAQIGFDQLREMSHDELRKVISRRVQMLDTVLREREERRAAIETAKLAARMLDLRRERALTIRKRVDIGSAIAAVACTMLIFVVMI